MIGRLQGVVADIAEDGSVVVDVAGVGYEVFVPLGAAGRLGGASLGMGVGVLGDGAGPVTFFVHTHVREDAITLFGFGSPEDRRAFRALLGVTGVGPKVALAILGSLDASALAEAVAREDKAAFKGIHGVGRKTVERILLDLQGKLPTGLARPASGRGAAPAPRAPGTVDTVVGALVNMGYKRAEVERALDAMPEGFDERPVETLLRDVLSALA